MTKFRRILCISSFCQNRISMARSINGTPEHCFVLLKFPAEHFLVYVYLPIEYKLLFVHLISLFWERLFPAGCSLPFIAAAICDYDWPMSRAYLRILRILQTNYWFQIAYLPAENIKLILIKLVVKSALKTKAIFPNAFLLQNNFPLEK